MSRYTWPFAFGLVVALGAVPASAQDLSAGKTPQQLFDSDCAACHRSPQGLGRGKNTSLLTSFLREHYTTKSAHAGALAAYLASLSGGSGAVRRPATAAEEQPRPGAKPKPTAEGATKPEEAKPETGPAAAKPAAAGEDSKPAEGPARPRAARVAPAAEPTGEPRPSGPRVREKPMTPAERLKSYSNAGENAKAAEEAQGEAKANAASRLEAYATSGADADAVGRSAGTEPGQEGKPAKPRKRGNRAAEAPQGEGAAAPASAPAPSPTAPAAGGAPEPAPPAAEEKK